MFLNTDKNIFFLILLGFLFFTFFIQAAVFGAPGPNPDEPPRAMWVWDIKIFQDQEATSKLLNFCKDSNIGVLFYTAYKVTGNNIEKDYRNFNKQAHRRGISVQALAGDPRWAIERYHHRFINWANDILEFNKNSSIDERFDGLHADVEPYLLGKMWEENSKGMLVQYLDITKKVKDFIVQSGSNILFVVDAPFWYDDDTDMWLEWQKKFSPGSYHLLDIIDMIVIMDYRNFAQGENGSILLVKNEVDYAAGIGKKVYIGQETGRGLKPEYVTFGGTNSDYMEKEIKKLADVYIGNPGFAGIAIHHYISYKKLLRESGKTVK